KRVKPAVLDSLLRTSLRDAGISLDYAYGVFAEPDSALKLAQPAKYGGQLLASDLRARLFPADIFSPRHDLVLFFPSRSVFLLQQIWPQLGATIVFMVIIALSFVYTIRTIIQQQRVSVLMTDFINNMTHEFKTPISTVALAVEAILRPDVISRREKIRRYSGIIMEENGRMRKQVEKILQMAVLERGEYELHVMSVDAHEILQKAVEGIALQVEERKGTVTCSYEARSSVIKVDPMHFTNTINNLLDNANKYSPDAPRILVSTHNIDGMLVIRITDNGIGIRAEDLPKVFERFYRVPTGNVHNVKGFGLGLSYVKLLVTAMGGEVGMNSKFGEGTTAELKIPTENGERGTGN
ncbi:sensor histidine kinase, partial [bacterium]